MKTMLTVAFLVAAASVAGAQERLADQLKKAVVQEEADRNPQKAIESYQRILAEFQEERKVAATALFRMAECYRKTGKNDQAIQAYQRVVREFPDQPALVESSRRQLVSTYRVPTTVPATTAAGVGSGGGTGSGAGTGRGAGTESGTGTGRGIGVAAGEAQAARPGSTPEAQSGSTPGLTRTDRTRIQTLESQMALVQQQIEGHEHRIAIGQESRDDPELFKLRQQLIMLRGQIQEIRDAAADRHAEETEATREKITSTDAEIATVRAKIRDYEKKFAVGSAAPTDPDYVALKQRLGVLQQKLRALELSLRR